MAFATLVHADWSKAPTKRWAATAFYHQKHWLVSAPGCVRETRPFVDDLFKYSERGAVLAGFDFPLGLPVGYGERTGLADFPHALRSFGSGRWQRFYQVAEHPAEVSLERPFYPSRSNSGALGPHLLAGHGVPSIDSLLRQCDRKTQFRRAACSMFWTLGGNQVGKAAIAGWLEVIIPALARGARLWPFDGVLAECADGARVVLAETYPAEAYRHSGVSFTAKESKRRQSDRARKAPLLLKWAAGHGVSLSAEMSGSIEAGFGNHGNGDDQFDATLGLFGMIEVVEGRRSEGALDRPGVRQWEGWILGMADISGPN